MSRLALLPVTLFLVAGTSFAQESTSTPSPLPVGLPSSTQAPGPRAGSPVAANFATAAGLSQVADPITKPLLVSRYRHSNTGRHAFTTDTQSQRRLPAAFLEEAVPDLIAYSPLFYVYTERYPATIPIYRFQDKDGAMYFAVTDDERGAFLSRGLEQIPQPVFIYGRQVEGSLEVFRVTNPRDGDTLYTTSSEEKDYYLKRGWAQLSSLGFAQPTSSSGTGILLNTTVKLESDDLPLVSRISEWGQTIEFSSANSKIGALAPGTVLYSEKNTVFPLGVVAKVVKVSSTGNGGIEVKTEPARLTEVFAEYRIYLGNRKIYFLRPTLESGFPKTTTHILASTTPEPQLRDITSDHAPRIDENDTTATIADNTVRPEYLNASASLESPQAVTGGYAGYYWQPTWTFNKSLLPSDSAANLTVQGSLSPTLTAEFFDNTYNQCAVNPTRTFVLSVSETGSLTVTASGQIGSSNEVEILPGGTLQIGTFPTPIGIPISVALDLFAGYDANGAITASLTGTETARATGELQYASASRTYSATFCPNPCPTGFDCGPSFVSGPTCNFTASIPGSPVLSATAEAKVYIKPQVNLYVGAFVGPIGIGVGPYVYSKLQLDAQLTTSNLNLHLQLVPGWGLQATDSCDTLQIYGPIDLSPPYPVDYTLMSFPLQTDADKTSLANQTVPVQWYYFQAPSGLWYILNSNGIVLALKSQSYASGTLPWEPINNYPAYAGFPAAGQNYSSVQLASNGLSVQFGSVVGASSNSDIYNLANTTQSVKWFYFTNPSASRWYILDAYWGTQAVLALYGYDPSVNGGIIWKPVSNYAASTGYPAAGVTYQYINVSSTGTSIAFGPLK